MPRHRLNKEKESFDDEYRAPRSAKKVTPCNFSSISPRRSARLRSINVQTDQSTERSKKLKGANYLVNQTEVQIPTLQPCMAHTKVDLIKPIRFTDSQFIHLENTENEQNMERMRSKALISLSPGCSSKQEKGKIHAPNAPMYVTPEAISAKGPKAGTLKQDSHYMAQGAAEKQALPRTVDEGLSEEGTCRAIVYGSIESEVPTDSIQHEEITGRPNKDSYYMAQEPVEKQALSRKAVSGGLYEGGTHTTIAFGSAETGVPMNLIHQGEYAMERSVMVERQTDGGVEKETERQTPSYAAVIRSASSTLLASKRGVGDAEAVSPDIALQGDNEGVDTHSPNHSKSTDASILRIANAFDESMSTDVSSSSEQAREQCVMVVKEPEGVDINVKDSQSHRDGAVDALDGTYARDGTCNPEHAKSIGPSLLHMASTSNKFMSSDVSFYLTNAGKENVMIETESEGVAEKVTKSQTPEGTAFSLEALLALFSSSTTSKQDIQAEETFFLDTAVQEDNGEGRYSPDCASCMSIGPSLLHMASAFNEDMSSDESTADTSVLQAGKYSVKSEVSPILDAIIEKYGDIAQYCTLKSPKYLAFALESVCTAVEDLRKMHFSDLRHHHLESLSNAINDAEQVKLDVEWLRLHLDELKKVVDLIPHYKSLKHNLAENSKFSKSKKKILDSKKLEILKLKMECRLVESELASMAAENSNLHSELSNIKPKLKGYHGKFAGDGLI